MRDNVVDITTVTQERAAKMTAENKYGCVWPAGLYVIVDNERSVLESRGEVEGLIEQLRQAADELWPNPTTTEYVDYPVIVQPPTKKQLSGEEPYTPVTAQEPTTDVPVGINPVLLSKESKPATDAPCPPSEIIKKRRKKK